ncbi:uncharacterized protein MONBRDRAFT_6208 [Monosiga brevicollis MX1]|uniref:HTH CENPB-type domain-containing protein n=1 Tax=Monosiga brevicollis TaxID=81824 RepID=A9UT57_MONBE|nr:uncharacterized protein MONBRDRAFT_6208 [Monosiga brevicollis MX1]EDQ91189.1 predicted protein [Monosiga brevicollis MX1]|eukprot:XP_001743611.1 hypothetical protein [Monosiga brevicollis MX1]
MERWLRPAGIGLLLTVLAVQLQAQDTTTAVADNDAELDSLDEGTQHADLFEDTGPWYQLRRALRIVHDNSPFLGHFFPEALTGVLVAPAGSLPSTAIDLCINSAQTLHTAQLNRQSPEVQYCNAALTRVSSQLVRDQATHLDASVRGACMLPLGYTLEAPAAASHAPATPQTPRNAPSTDSDARSSAKRSAKNRSSLKADRVKVCKMIDPQRNGSRVCKVSDALNACGITASPAAVSHWLRGWRHGDLVEANGSLHRSNPLQFPELDEHMRKYVEDHMIAASLGFGQNWRSLKEEAAAFAKARCERGDEKYANFQNSHGWLARFCKRYGVKARLLRGVSGPALPDNDEVRPAMETYRSSIDELAQQHNVDAERIYCMDEFTLFYNQPPQGLYSPLEFQEPSGSNHMIDDARLTGLACVNATGSHAIPCAAVSNLEKPYSFVSLPKLPGLPVPYMPQSRGWVDEHVLLWWFTDVFQPAIKARHGERDVILILDSAPVHVKTELPLQKPSFPNVHLSFLPACSVSNFQPLTRGITAVFKTFYKAMLLQRTVTCIPNGATLHQLRFTADPSGHPPPDSGLIHGARASMLEALELMNEAWSRLSPDTITISWRQADCLSQRLIDTIPIATDAFTYPANSVVAPNQLESARAELTDAFDRVLAVAREAMQGVEASNQDQNILTTVMVREVLGALALRVGPDTSSVQIREALHCYATIEDDPRLLPTIAVSMMQSQPVPTPAPPYPLMSNAVGSQRDLSPAEILERGAADLLRIDPIRVLGWPEDAVDEWEAAKASLRKLQALAQAKLARGVNMVDPVGPAQVEPSAVPVTAASATTTAPPAAAESTTAAPTQQGPPVVQAP